jgi:hypothetical protein
MSDWKEAFDKLVREQRIPDGLAEAMLSYYIAHPDAWEIDVKHLDSRLNTQQYWMYKRVWPYQLRGRTYYKLRSDFQDLEEFYDFRMQIKEEQDEENADDDEYSDHNYFGRRRY